MVGRPQHRDEQHVAELVRVGVHGLQVSSVALIGEGVDHLAYEVNGELVVRFSKEDDPTRRAELIRSETGLLAAVAQISPLRVPEPVFTDAEQGCWAYAKIPGTPLLDLPAPQRLRYAPALAATLGRFLSALHAAPSERMAQFVSPDQVPMAEWRDEAAENYTAVVKEIHATRRGPVEAFLTAAPPEAGDGLVFSHNDLGIEHVLISPDTQAITGVIDWSDAAFADPAYDFALLYRDLGPAALTAALTSYPAQDTAAFHDRVTFYARCGLLEDLAYGIQTGLKAYVGKSITALEWLFPA
jgi:aminoglycoside phosphotransferase (APT) family kinase protein